jgi:glucosamine--fructose-6-phosphate aminotransferase (isomerizing)
MCGIIGIISRQPVAERVLEGLQRLEYRGYDSAGIATSVAGKLLRRRAKGKLIELQKVLINDPLSGNVGIGHTRWATHGAPTENNAHPHATDKVAVVHNGIIENFQHIKNELIAKGCTFESDTDTETIPVLLTEYLRSGLSIHEAVKQTLQKLEGAFALGMIFAQDSHVIYIARKGSPLAIGLGEGEMFIGSDAIALAPFASKLIYLEEGDWAKISLTGAEIYNESGTIVERAITLFHIGGAAVGKENYRHFMEKEIHEQPTVIADTLRAFHHGSEHRIILPNLKVSLKDATKITLVACGTSYYSAMVAKYWLEEYGQLTIETDVASEFRYRAHHLPKNGIAVFISQSGETADTLAALRAAKSAGQFCIAIVNVPTSSMAREADLALNTYAGPEIGVASTKAFTTQLVVLACLSLAIGLERGTLTEQTVDPLIHALAELPSKILHLLRDTTPYAELAHSLSHARDALYLGRGTSYPIALEGALKLKEISYIHAEGYAAGEMKHGPIALIDESVPVIILLPHDKWYEKTLSNMQEAKARGGQIILLAAESLTKEAQQYTAHTLAVPDCHPFVSPILYAVPVQLLAYYTAVAKGTDIDQPRNLAKSVTVE